jgi:energy-converting hydrogenase Eha subunit A
MAGVITVIGSCIAFAFGIISLTVAWLYIGINDQIRLHVGGPYLQFPTYYLSIGILAIIMAAFGLFAGIALVNKKFFNLSLFGSGSLLFCGVLITIPFESTLSWQAGLPVIFLQSPV